MDLNALRASLDEPAPPMGLPPLLKALWHEAKGNWTAAHEIAQADGSEEAALIHGYLHRVEGDGDNAAYWYARAGETLPDNSLEEEWFRIATMLLEQ